MKKYVFFLAIMCLFLHISGNQGASAGTVPVVKDGVLDLRNTVFPFGAPVALDGDWEYFHRRHIDAKADAERADGVISVPGRWNSRHLQESAGGETGYGSCRMTILLPKEKKNDELSLALKLKSINTAYRLYINGKEVSRGGTAGVTAKSTIPKYAPTVVVFSPGSPVVEITFHISNYHHQKWGILQSLTLARAPVLARAREKNIYIDLILFGSIFFMGLYYLTLFLIRRRDPSSLFFGLLCMLISLRVLVMGEKVLVSFFPELAWRWVVFIEYFSYYMGTAAVVVYVHYLFRIFRPLYMKIIVALATAFSLFTFAAPVIISSHGIFYFHPVLALSSLMVLVTLIIALKRKHDGSLVLLFSFIVFLACVVNDVLHGQQVIQTDLLTPYGLLFFIFSQSFLLSKRFLNAFGEKERLTIEMDTLNRDLEKKVDDRTRELSRLNEKLQKNSSELQNSNLKLHELDEAKTDFFTNISHELRTPLTLIISKIEAVLEGSSPRKVDNSFLEDLLRTGRRLKNLINSILDLSKIDSKKLVLHVHEVDISKYLKRFIGSIQSAEDMSTVLLSLETPDTTFLYLDIEKFDFAVMNLFSNAMKFTEPGGKIAVSVFSDEKWVNISVSDTGIGIPASDTDRIFERFRQVPGKTIIGKGGTGIGLALVKEIAEIHGGRVEVESRHIDQYPEAHGSVFTLVFPRGSGHLEDREDVIFLEPSDSDEYEGGKFIVDLPKPDICCRDNQQGNEHEATILIIDDNKEMRSFLHELLSSDHNIIMAENGLEGLRAARMCMPDVVVSDVMMPVVDGFEFVRELRNDPNIEMIPVILLTARAGEENRMEGFVHGADDYIAKPFNPALLRSRVAALIERSRYQKLIYERNICIEADLDTARLLQNRLLPSKLPEFSEASIHVQYIPVDKVSGDFYDYFVIDNKLHLFIADVSGHGLPGAFLATVTKMALDSAEDKSLPSGVLQEINKSVCHTTVNGNFVTAFYGVIDPQKKRMLFSNAGHVTPVLFRRSTGEFLPAYTRGRVLGWSEEPGFVDAVIDIVEGDRLVMYTDGITECMNDQREVFGEARLVEFLKENSNASKEDFSRDLIAALRAYSGDEEFDDDLCLLVTDFSFEK